MPSYSFFQTDVFTSQPLGGNPLEVFPDASSLDSELMQKIAREMNLSETTFVFPPDKSDADFKVRIFTPGREIPFGGHPTIGTADVLKQAGVLPTPLDSVTFEMGVGNVSVSWENGIAFMQQPLPEFQPPLASLHTLETTLSEASGALETRLPVQVVTTGFPALLVPLSRLDSLQALALNQAALKEVLGAVDMLYAFCLETESVETQVHARGFAPFIGIPEDPATGSVAGALGAYLLEHLVFGEGDSLSIRIEQGLEMGRPSRIEVETKKTGDEFTSVRVGGQSALVIEGVLKL